MLFRQRVNTIAYAVKFVNLLQNGSSRHCVPDFRESLRRDIRDDCVPECTRHGRGTDRPTLSRNRSELLRLLQFVHFHVE